MIKSILIKQKKIIENIFSLSALNALNYLIPLLTLPYIVRVIGVEKYGAVAFALTTVQYIVILSTYGFQYSATKAISVNRENTEKINHIFSAVLTLKALFSFTFSLLYLLFIYQIPSLREHHLLYVFALGIPLGNALLPVWLFQGLEKMNLILMPNLISKSLMVVCIFSFINDKEDYIFISLMHGISFVLSGIIGVYIAIYKLRIKFSLPSKHFFVLTLKDGLHIFLSTIGINLYRNANIFLLGVMTNNMLVGYYASAEKIIKALQATIAPISVAIFPSLSKKFELETEYKNIGLLFKLFYPFALALTILAASVIIFSPKLIHIAFGENFEPSITNLRFLSPVIIFGGINYFLGIIGLYNLGYKKQFSKFVLISGFSGIILTIFLITLLDDKGASIALTLSELILSIFLVLFLFRRKNKDSNLLI